MEGPPPRPEGPSRCPGRRGDCSVSVGERWLPWKLRGVRAVAPRECRPTGDGPQAAERCWRSLRRAAPWTLQCPSLARPSL